MFGNQTTIPQDRRYQDTYEDRTCGVQQPFPHLKRTRTPEEDCDPFRQDAAAASMSQLSGLEAAHSAADRTHPDNTTIRGKSGLDAAHSAADRNYPGQSSTTIVAETAAAERLNTVKPIPKKRTLASLPVAAFRSFADNAVTMLSTKIRRLAPAEVAAPVRYDATTHRTQLPSGLQRAPQLAAPPRSAAVPTRAQRPVMHFCSSDGGPTLVNASQPVHCFTSTSGTKPSDGPAAARPTSQAAARTAADASHTPAAPADSAASGLMPSGASSTSGSEDDGKDRRSESAFYRNATYNRSCDNDAVPPPFVLMEPPIEPFDGDVRKYPRFRDRFVDIIEAQPNLEPRHKLMYLIQYLRGEPLHLADRLQYTDENYFAVIDLLEERYGDKHRLKNLLIQDLIDHPPPPSTKLSDMTRFHDDIFQLVSDLRPFRGTHMDEPSDPLAEVLLGKLPFGIRWRLFKEAACTTDLNLDGLLSGLNHLIRQTRLAAFPGPCFTADGRSDEDPDTICRKEKDASSSHTSNDDSLAESMDGSYEEKVDEAAELTAVAENASTEEHLKERRTCPLCGLLHTAARCTSFTTINRRLRRIQKLELCLLCLREGHRAVTCPRRTTDSCRICHKGPHNRA
ncbi:Pao retrotransposon peptidase family protein-like, partial [Aphelenchoides avenae]